jgi:hypothetical protein
LSLTIHRAKEEAGKLRIKFAVLIEQNVANDAPADLLDPVAHAVSALNFLLARMKGRSVA